MANIIKIGDFPKVEANPDRVPSFLRCKPCANWTAEPRSGQPGKYNKAPRNPLNGAKVGADKPELFGTFEQAVSALDSGKFSGIGVLLTGDDNLTGVDIDDYKATFEQMPQVKAWVAEARKAGAYCELSPSGEGLRLFMRGKLPSKGRKAGPLEIYDNARFLTVTGKCEKASGGELIDGQHLIDSFIAMLPAQEPVASRQIGSIKPASNEAVIALVAWATEKRPALMAGHWELSETDFGSTGYTSQSEADMALVGEIARQAVRSGIAADELADCTLRVFEQSGLYRPEKARTIENFTIPKAVAAALESEPCLVETRQDAPAENKSAISAATEFATGEPGDIKAATVFAKTYSGRLLYAAQGGRWLYWDGSRWCWCNTGEEMQAAKKVADKALEWASKLCQQDADKNKKRMAFALRLQNLPRLQAMLELARSEPGMTIGHMSEFDSDPMLIGARNGVVNLNDGGLLAPDQKMLITRQIAAEYHPDAKCPRWLEFLNQVMQGDTETIGFLQRALGYTLTGTTTEEVLFICYGHGANGKSVFGNVVTAIMADYGQMAPASLLTARKDGDSGPRNDVARLCGARAVQINETSNGDRLDEQVVKMLAGREMISARFLHREFFDFWPTAKPWLRTNHRPIVVGEDCGIWRRLLLIPFRQKFAEHERDPWLESKLLEERDGIFAWMVRGCLEWKRGGGLKPSDMVRRESAGYRTESDLLGEFLGDKTEAAPSERTGESELYSQWRNWNDQNGTRSGSKASFTRKLHERGFSQEKSNGKRYYAGLKSRPQGIG
ncbi:MAG: hypothetical protein KKE51_03595 [Gammaproteobacteria bacterium]|nr:hypothetical protein [Gammaproteobacteria bacterium]MBU1602189.1 hypothetical protein [Gammaproteobacteria bacterium]MBU2434236.1 hypothetical protein [Gammaproteobacteria bacterium]MBU2448440.1 hypothetical protein [Gammaproteobacteria bacterium]